MTTRLPMRALLINTTTLGMAGQPGACPRSSRRFRGMPSSPILSTCRSVTPLLERGQARGLRTADGLGMLLHQAVRGFALWFGRTPTVTAELRALVEADLGVSPKPG